MPRASLAFALALITVAGASAGCLGGTMGARAESRPVDAVGGDVRILEAQEAVSLDLATQTVQVRVEGRARADGALDALLGVYVAKGPCAPRGGAPRSAPESPLAQESFAFPAAGAELRVQATLRGGPVLPGDVVHVVWLGDAANALGLAYRCAAYRLSPALEPPPGAPLPGMPAPG